jgi:hypothetical protein
MKSDSIFKAIKQIYPAIEGGFTYSPADGLVWENTQYSKPQWSQIEALIPAIELQEAKDAKLAEIQQARDAHNISPMWSHIAPRLDNNEPTQFCFYTNRHPSNPASDPTTILLGARSGVVYYSTKDLSGNSIVVIIDSALGASIEEHIKQRNTNAYMKYGNLKTQINNANTIEEVEAITW